MAKAKKTDDNEISLDVLLPAVDRKDYDWWKTLTSGQQSSFKSWLYMRFISSVQHKDPAYSMYYLRSVNQNVNRNFNSTKDHPQLIYLLMCVSSPGLGTQRHNWIPPGKKGSMNKKRAMFSKLYPLCNDLELDILEESNSKEDLMQFMLDLGRTDKEINEAMQNLDE